MKNESVKVYKETFLKEETFNPEIIPWLNSEKIVSSISVEV